MVRAKEHKPLLRSKGIIAGVCAGIAKYFDVDAIVVRVGLILLTLCTCGFMVVPYVLLAMVLPAETDTPAPIAVDPLTFESDRYRQVAGEPGCEEPKKTTSIDKRYTFVAIMLLILLTVGLLALCSALMPYVPGKTVSLGGFAPLILAAVGIIVLVCGSKGMLLTTRVFLLIFCCEAAVALLPFTLGLCPPIALQGVGETSLLLWFAAALSLMACLVFGRGDLLGLVIVFTGFAMASTAFDIGLFQWFDAASSYSHHNLTSPLFRQ